MPSTNSIISLREITCDTVDQILDLRVAENQQSFVDSNALSLAEAELEPNAWFRAIYADDTPVGFLMTKEVPEPPFYYLWRLMIDQRYQKMGFGRQAVELLIARIKTVPNATELVLSAEAGKGSPIGFYERLGFYATGEIDDDEFVYKINL